MDGLTIQYAKLPETKRKNSPLLIQRTKSSQPIKTPADRILFLQRTIGNQAVQRLIKSGTLQAKLKIGQPGDKYEQEADRVADAVMRMPEPGVQRQVEPEEEEEEILQTKPLVDQITPVVQRQVEEEEEEEMLQAKSMEDATSEVSNDLESQINAIKGGGRPLGESERAYFEPRFGVDFSQVKVHTGAQAAESARVTNARAFTLGQDVVFGEGEYSPQTSSGKKLLAHELSHVMQQEIHESIRNKLIQREVGGATAIAALKLDYKPSIHDNPCACLVFIHNNERNARMAAENLHRYCRYNLAIIEPGTRRRISIPGRSGDIDPNELFPQSIQEECTDDEPGCRAYLSRHNNLRSMQIQFFLAIKDCSNNFALPTVALHNNDVSETAAFRQAIPGIGHEIAALMEDIDRGTEAGRGSREDLRNRLEFVSEGSGEDFRGLMTSSGTTNIFRWCNLPEIIRCHVGDPSRPDHVIWVTNVRDYEILRHENVNVVLQEGLGTTNESESETDLSTLFLRLGPDARYLNIETPITPEDDDTRLSNMIFILRNLSRVGLNCCSN